MFQLVREEHIEIMTKRHTCPSCGHHYSDTPKEKVEAYVKTTDRSKSKAKRSNSLACATCKAKIGHRDDCAAAEAMRVELRATAAEWKRQLKAGVNIFHNDLSWLSPQLPYGEAAIKSGAIHPFSNNFIQFGPDTVFDEGPRSSWKPRFVKHAEPDESLAA